MNKEFSASRRNVLKGATAIAGLSMAGSSLGATGQAHHHEENPNIELVDAALHCLKTGQICLSHCMSEFKKGNDELADCASSVQEMLSMCSAMSQMVGLESAHVKK